MDFAGTSALVLCILALLIGLDRGENVSWNDKLTLGAFASFFMLSILFVIIETNVVAEPFVPGRIAVNPSLLASYLCNFFCIAASVAIVFHVSMYIQAVNSDSAVKVGLALIPSVLGVLVGSLTGGLVIQVTGKYYAYIVLNFTAMVIGQDIDKVLGIFSRHRMVD